jgi:SAM-dependent methyltransferase
MDVVPVDWYKHWFGNEYLTVYAHRNESEARTLIRLIQRNLVVPSGGRILDLCCGQGRHALLLANMGYAVVGIDLSRTLLNIAKFKHSAAGNAFFVQADMRFLPAQNTYDLLLNLFTSFGYFESDEENQSVFKQFVVALKPEGQFVFDYFNAPHLIENLVLHQKDKLYDGFIQQERRLYRGRVEKKITIQKNGTSSVFYESVKIYYPDQIIKMIQKAGLQINKTFGDYNGHPINPEMPRLVVIGNKMA